MTPSLAGPRRPRIALYSHDTMGLGHIRRNILLATALVKPPLQAEVLLISGIREAGAFELPAGVDMLTLPAYHKASDGSYRPRTLGDDVTRLAAMRGESIAAALCHFEPDLFIVDNVPRGAMCELDSVLPMLAHMPTRVVLGLRDIIDEPEAVLRQWREQQNFEALQAHYHAIWVYGDARLYDTAQAYGFDAALCGKLTTVGYLDQRQRMGCEAPPDGAGESKATAADPFMLCLVGGGQDGMALTEAFARAELPPGHRGVILAGAMMPAAARERLRGIAAARRGMSVIDFVSEPLALMRQASGIVAMAGYNTTTEILSLGKRALLVPRVKPRQEQWIRARRLAELGLVDCLHPDELSVAALSGWLGVARAPRVAHEVLDFNGLENVCALAHALLHGQGRGTDPRQGQGAWNAAGQGGRLPSQRAPLQASARHAAGEVRHAVN